ncbi:MAG: hypothetical protein U9R39_05150, partial [Campylobacterota bacterium]|nr:hypothetical protein [Campylobacterota bacterium]
RKTTMIKIKDMTMPELASYVCTALDVNGIDVVLSGGSFVEIYSRGDYTSFDIDLINRYNDTFFKIKKVMENLGFEEDGKYFIYPETKFFIEFPSGPLGVGDAPVKKIEKLSTKYGTLKLLTATDCIKDRLAAYYHWDDEQGLSQSIWVAQKNDINLEEIKLWSQKEQSIEKYNIFVDKLDKVN